MARAAVLGRDLRVSVIGVRVPPVGRTDVRIAVEVASVSRSAATPPSILGSELAGVIVEIGPDVREFVVGDRVIAVVRSGAWTTEIVLPSAAVSRIARTLPFDLSLLVPCSGLVAVAGLDAAGVRPGGVVLVAGAAGATSCIIAGLCRARGIDTVAICADHGVAEKIAPAGFGSIVVAADIESGSTPSDLTAGRPIDAVIDFTWQPAVVFDRFGLSADAAIVRIPSAHSYATTPRAASEDPRLKHVSLVRFVATDRARTDEAVAELTAGLSTGSIRVPIVQFSLDDAGAAFERIRSGDYFGKVVVRARPAVGAG